MRKLRRGLREGGKLKDDALDRRQPVREAGAASATASKLSACAQSYPLTR